MERHLLQRTSKLTIALLNITGVVVFYVAFSDAFMTLTYSVPITVATVIAIRLSFCILTHQALVSSGAQRILLFTVVMLIGLAPILRAPHPVPMPFFIQIALDMLIVLITAGVHASDQRVAVAASQTTYVMPEHTIALDDVMESYGVNEFGAFFLYVPVPLKRGDVKASALVDILKAHHVVKSCYRVDAKYATKAARQSQPHLFDRHVDAFDIYRLDQSRLGHLAERMT